MLRLLALFLFATYVAIAADPSAEALARAANKAQNSGQLVRAYLLYAEAAARDPKTEKYRVNRDGLKPLADLLSKAGIEKETPHDELLSSVPKESDEPVAPLDPEEQAIIRSLKPPVQLTVPPGAHSFHSRGDERSLFTSVAGAYGVKTVFDPLFEPRGGLRFDIEDVGFKDALLALTDETNTFVFAISTDTIFIARDIAQKRDEYEPQIAVSVPLPEVIDDKTTSEVSNAVRQAFELRHVGIDSSTHAIVIRDKLSRATGARTLLESLIKPKAQIAVEVEILTLSDTSSVKYGLNLPKTFPILNLGALLRDQTLVTIPTNFINFVTFGGGRTLFGIGVTDAQAIATSTKSTAKSIYDLTVVVSAGQTAQMHVGDKYPVAQMLYTGASTLANPLAGPAAQIQMVDLGILVKVKPELHTDGDITMEIHAEYQALGALRINTVPEILNRQFDGTVRLHAGELAVLAGLDTQTSSDTKTGIIGLSQIPAVGNLFSVIDKTHDNSQTLVLLRPHSTRDYPESSTAEYYVGGQSGPRVLL